MLGFSTGQLLVILGACSVMMSKKNPRLFAAALFLSSLAVAFKPSDMVKIARTAGRMTGRAVGRLIVARRQLDEILGQSAATKVHKELKEAMTQLDTIRYEVQSLSRLTPGQFTTRQHDTGSGMAEAGKSDASDGSVTKLEEFRHEIRSIIRDEIESFYKTRPDSIKNYACSTDARKLDVSADPMALKSKDTKMANTGEPTGSDLVLEAVLEAEVANNAKIFVSPPRPDQLPKE
ncbi:hypothetical protein EJB05_54399, partial [Eragrostis curvula]